MSQSVNNNHEFAAWREQDAGYPPNLFQPQRDQFQWGESDYFDSSGPLFSMYLDKAEEEDRNLVESWRGDADGMLIFIGLFSAVVAQLLAMSIPELQPNSQDTSAYYLAHIYQQISQSNGSQVSIPSTLSDPTAPFTPPTSAIWINLFWFLSLVMSFTCALMAMLIQQWARRYLRVAYPRHSPLKRARIRAFYAEGVKRSRIQWMVDALPILLHMSLFLFFAGVSVFLSSVNLTIFKTLILLVGLCVVGYAILTFLPIFYRDSPFSTPLSVLASSCLNILFQILERFPPLDPSRILFCYNRDMRAVYHDGVSFRSMRRTAEEFALRLDPDIDYRALSWTFETLDEDKELEQFFEGIPGLCSSEAVPDTLSGFIKPNERRLSSALIGLMNRTLSSNLVPESVKQRQIVICMKAIEATSLLAPSWILHRVLGDWNRFLGCVEFGLFVKSWKRITHPVTAFYAQCVVAVTIWTVQERDERWFQLTSGQLNASKSLIQKYLSHGDSMLFANFIFILRRTVQTCSGLGDRYRSDILAVSSRTLESVCKFDAHDTLPELQHEFCSLWNQLVHTAQNDQRPHIAYVSMAALKNIHKLYVALHEGSSTFPIAFSTTTGSHPVLNHPMTYPLCTTQGHRPSLPVPELQLDEPSHDTTGSAPPTPAMSAVEFSPSHPTQVSVLPSASPMPSLHPYPTVPAVPSTIPIHHSTSRVDLFFSSTTPIPAPTAPHIAFPLPSPVPPLHHTDIFSLTTGISRSSPTSIATLPPLRPRRLVCRGNMCFANAVLQLLVHCPPFWNLFGELGRLMRQERGSCATPLVDATARFLGEFMYEKPFPTQQPQPRAERRGVMGEEKKENDGAGPFEPTYLYDVMKSHLDRTVEDPEEFFSLYLDALGNELNALLASITSSKPASDALRIEGAKKGSQSGEVLVLTAKAFESPITRIFGGKFRTTLRAPNQPDSVFIENWLSLPLFIQNDSAHTIQDTLARLAQPQSEPVDLSNSSEMNKQVLIEAFPTVLVLHLMRSQYGTATSDTIKVDRPIQFTPELEIPLGPFFLLLLLAASRAQNTSYSVGSDIMAPAPAAPGLEPAQPAHYMLFGVLYRHDESAGQGHYTVDVLHPNQDGGTRDSDDNSDGSGEGAWLHIDDERVSAVQHEAVFRGDDEGDRYPYMLFYRRVDST
ncbi:hypothetical protein BJV74DRAFT_54400 [Russula compacta]|nr:hypothetical protein BJV74DRAFT_54400 [Russula compacta]